MTMAALSSSNSSDYLSGIQKTVLTSCPTVTLLVTRIPFSLTEEGLLNLLRKCGDVTVLNCKLVVNKGGFAGIRGLNYAYVTLAEDEAGLVIEQLNMQPPFNLGVTYKPSEEDRTKMREEGLMERALGIIEQKGDNFYKEKAIEYNKKDMTELNIDKKVNKEDEDKVSCKKLVDTVDEVYSFNNPLKLPFIGQKVDHCGVCGNRAVVCCSGCQTIFYCSQNCQIADWSAHKGICKEVDKDYVEAGIMREKDPELKKKTTKQLSSQADIKHDTNGNDNSSYPKSSEHSPQNNSLSSGPSSSGKLAIEKIYDLNNNCDAATDLSCSKYYNEDQQEPDVTQSCLNGSVERAIQTLEKMSVVESMPVVESQVDEVEVDNPSSISLIGETSEQQQTFLGRELFVSNQFDLEHCSEEDKDVLAANIDDKFPRESENLLTEKKVEEAQLACFDFVAEDELEQSDNLIECTSLNASEQVPPFQSFLKLKGAPEAPSTHKLSKENQIPSSQITMIEPSQYILPTFWTRLDTPVAQITNPELFQVRLEGLDQNVEVKLSEVKVVKPWTEENNEIMNMVLGGGVEGQAKLWVRHVGWEGDIQLVEIKDQEDNDVATLLSKVGIMEPVNIDCSIVDTRDKSEVDEACKASVHTGRHLFARELEQCVLTSGMLVKLKDIGESSQFGLVRCVQEKDRAWLEEVMELSDHTDLIQNPQVGQLVAFVMQTSVGSKIARAEIIEINEEKRKAFCQCLDYHDRRWIHLDDLFQPAPACLTIPPLCVKVKLQGVPSVPRKEAKEMLEKGEVANILSQVLFLNVVSKDDVTYEVELFDLDKNSINELLASFLNSYSASAVMSDVLTTTSSPSITTLPTISCSVTVSTATASSAPLLTVSSSVADFSTASSPMMSPDFADLNNYRSLPLNTQVRVIILHVESPSHIFVCPSDSWEELRQFQTYLQSLGDSVPDVSSMQAPVVGQIMLARSDKDKSWYRGTVIRLQKTKAKIYCPDFGFVEKISLSNLRPVTDLDVARANYWGNMCTLSDWREGQREASNIEEEWIKTKLKVCQEFELIVTEIAGVKYTVDVQGISRC